MWLGASKVFGHIGFLFCSRWVEMIAIRDERDE
jgi:hypothetical protein